MGISEWFAKLRKREDDDAVKRSDDERRSGSDEEREVISGDIEMSLSPSATGPAMRVRWPP